MYYKVINGKAVKGDVIHTPKGTLNNKTKDKPVDGWQWFDDTVTASASLGVEIKAEKSLMAKTTSLSTNPMAIRLDTEIARLESQLEAKKAERASFEIVEVKVKNVRL